MKRKKQLTLIRAAEAFQINQVNDSRFVLQPGAKNLIHSVMYLLIMLIHFVSVLAMDIKDVSCFKRGHEKHSVSASLSVQTGPNPFYLTLHWLVALPTNAPVMSVKPLSPLTCTAHGANPEP